MRMRNEVRSLSLRLLLLLLVLLLALPADQSLVPHDAARLSWLSLSLLERGERCGWHLLPLSAGWLGQIGERCGWHLSCWLSLSLERRSGKTLMRFGLLRLGACEQRQARSCRGWLAQLSAQGQISGHCGDQIGLIQEESRSWLRRARLMISGEGEVEGVEVAPGWLLLCLRPADGHLLACLLLVHRSDCHCELRLGLHDGLLMLDDELGSELRAWLALKGCAQIVGQMIGGLLERIFRIPVEVGAGRQWKPLASFGHSAQPN